MSRRDRNWTIVQMYYRDPEPVSAAHPSGWSHRCEKYVVYEPLKSDAERLVESWLNGDPSRRENLYAVHYYPRNYVDIEHDLRLRGRIIGGRP